MLFITIHNDSTGDTKIGNYTYQVRINQDLLASGRIESHKRADGWVKLLQTLIDHQTIKASNNPQQETIKAKQPEDSQNRLIPVTKWNDFYDWPTEAGLRHLIFFEKQNGFNKVVRRVGRRVLINEKAFFEWVDKNNN